MLRTTLFDGDAISVRESLLLGTPVIASDTGARPDGCRLFPVGDEAALVKEINAVITAGKKPRKIGTPDNSNIESVLAIYDSLSKHVRK